MPTVVHPASRVALFLLASLTVACGGEPEPRPEAPPTEAPQPAGEASQSRAETTDEDAPATEPATEDPGPDFDTPFPDDPCSNTALALSHASVSVPAGLSHAVALRSEDGRFVRIAAAAAPLERDDRGRFVPPADGAVRFEFEAIRRRRGTLEAGALGPPDSRRTALSHARVVTPGPILTFGHREVGRVELTQVGEDRICGRVDLNDGFLRVRGPFSAEVIGAP